MMAMRILLVIGVLFTIAAGISIFNKPLIEPPNVILKPSNFDRLEELGAVLFRRFWVENQNADLVVFVSSPFVANYDLVWSGFLNIARNEGRKFDSGFNEVGLRNLGSQSSPIDMAMIQKSLGEGQRIWIHMPYNQPKIALLKALHPRSLIFIQSILPVTDREVQLHKSICHSGRTKGELICDGPDQISKRELKGIVPNKNIAAVYQVGPGQMLVDIFEPTK